MDVKRSYYAIIPANVRYDSRLKPNAKLLYGEITALCNEKGFCWAGNEYFAELYEVSKETISRWISDLIDCGYLKRDIIYKEGTLQIINRYLRINQYPIDEIINTPIDEKVKDNNTSFNTTVNTTNNIRPSDKSDRISHSDNFDKLWGIYPKGRKQGKDKAFAAYKRAIKAGTTDDEILQGLEAYKKQIAVQKTELHFVKQGATWFNQKCWTDEYLTESIEKPQQKSFYQNKPTRQEKLPDWATDNYNHEKAEEARRSGMNFGELPEINFDDDLPF